MATSSKRSAKHELLKRTLIGNCDALAAVVAAVVLLHLGEAFGQQGAAKPASTDITPVTSRELIEIRGLSALSVSPDERYAVVLLDQQRLDINTTSQTWNLIDLASGRVKELADAGSPMWNVNGWLATEPPQWSVDSRWIYYRAAKGEEAQIWRVGRDGSGAEQVTHEAADVQAFTLDGASLLHFATAGATRDEIKAAESQEYDQGVLLDRTVIPGFSVVQNFPVNGRMATIRFLPPSISRERITLLGDRAPRIKTLNTLNGQISPSAKSIVDRFEARSMSGLGPRFAGSGAARFRPDDRLDDENHEVTRSRDQAKLVYVARAAPPEQGLSTGVESRMVWKNRNGSETACQLTICDAADSMAAVGWTKSGRELVFQALTHGVESIHAWDTGRDTVRTIATKDGTFGADNSGRQGVCKLAGEEVVCVTGSADAPPQLVGINLKTGAQRFLLNPNPHLTPERLGETTRLALTDRFGSKAFARLVLPPNDKRSQQRLPLVITSYNCDGFLLGGTGADVPEHVLAGRGFAALCIDVNVGNVRRPPGFWQNKDATAVSMLDFYEDAIRVLSERGVIDPRRVAAAGFSGSTTTVSYMLTQTQFAAAMVTTQGSLDAIGCYLAAHLGQCRKLSENAGYPRPYDSRTGRMANSPAWNADKITTPLLMQLAEVEHRNMLQLYSALSEYDRSVEIYVFPDAYHVKHLPRQRLSVYERNVDWAAFWLKGETGPEAADKHRYVRWRAMREKQCQFAANHAGKYEPPWYC